MKRHRPKVIVLGVGAVGSATLYSLAKRGMEVIGIDRFSPPHDKGSSHGSTRLIRQAYFEDPRYIPLLRESYEGWEQLEARSQKKLFERVGLLTLCPSDYSLGTTIQENAKRFEIPCHSLSQSELANRFPQFKVPSGSFGIWEPNAGYLRVEECQKTFIECALNEGAQLHPNESVLHWESDGRSIQLKTDRSHYTADYLVVSAGVWARDFLPHLDIQFSVTRAPQFWFQGNDMHSPSNGMPCFAFAEPDQFIYGFPHVEDWGVKVASYTPSHAVEDSLNDDPHYLPKELAPIAQAIERHLPGVGTTPIRHKMCYYNLTPDENFLVGPHPQHSNVILATGGSGHAFKFIPFLGDLVTNYVQGSPFPQEVEFLNYREGLA